MSKGLFDVELLGLVCSSFRFLKFNMLKCQGCTVPENQMKKLFRMLLQEVKEKSKEKLLPGGKVKRYLACPGFRGLDGTI